MKKLLITLIGFLPFSQNTFGQCNFAVNAGPDVAYCKGSEARLTASGAVSYSWSPATGLSSTSVSNPVASPSTTTLYIVSGTDANGCKGVDSVFVNVKPRPTVNAGIDTTICVRDYSEPFQLFGKFAVPRRT